MFASSSQQSVDGLLASYNLSLMIVKKGKPHTIGEELILPTVKEVLNTVLHHKACSSVIKSIPLSNDTVQRRIDEMSADIEHKLLASNWTNQLCLVLSHYYLAMFVLCTMEFYIDSWQ